MSLENVNGEVMTSSPRSHSRRSTASQQGRRTRVDHHAVALGQQIGPPPFELCDTRAEIEPPVLQHLDDGLDLPVVVHGA